jgi:CheY-like chemotaxis protein
MTARILVVDDEPDLEALIQQKFRHQIRDGAVSFLFAGDGVDALAVLKANRDVDMVVTDINMPRMDGLLLLQKLQENEEKLSTIIVSAYGDMANIRTAMNRGAFDFLTKPIDFLDLEKTIAKTIRHVEVLREARRRQAEAERAHASLSRYFSPNLAERLASDVDAIDLCGQRREIATLFTDIASFTALVETLEPDVLGPLLNDYLTGMTDIVFVHDGTVAKIVGDALHVMSRGLGSLQRDIKEALTKVADNGYGPLGIAGLRQWLVARAGGDPELDTLRPAGERSLRRAINALLDRGEIFVIAGEGGPGDPRRDVTVECFANTLKGETVKDTAHAKAIVAELSDMMLNRSKEI